MTIIAAADVEALSVFGSRFWLNEFQPIMGMQGYQSAVEDSILDAIEKPLSAGALRATVIDGVDRLVVVANIDFGRSLEKAVILSLPIPGVIDGATLFDAVWAGYLLSLKATMDGGRNPRAHVEADGEDSVGHAHAIVARIGAIATPCDEVYGSDSTYLEGIKFGYDPVTRVLSADPWIGS